MDSGKILMSIPKKRKIQMFL